MLKHFSLKILMLCFFLLIFPVIAPLAETAAGVNETRLTQNPSPATALPDASASASENFFSSEAGVMIAWIATIASLVVGSIPLGLFYFERKKSQLLNEILNQFKVKETLEKQKNDASASKADIEAALEKSKSELSTLTKDIEESVPLRARAAFYATALPEIEMEILRLSEQRKVLIRKLGETGFSEPNSTSIKNILDFEINSTVTARRKLDEKQTMLSIFSGFAAASAFMDVFGEFGYAVSLILGLIILWIAHDLGVQWALVYPETRVAKILGSKFYKLLPAIAAAILLLIMFALAYLILNPVRSNYY